MSRPAAYLTDAGIVQRVSLGVAMCVGDERASGKTGCGCMYAAWKSGLGVERPHRAVRPFCLSVRGRLEETRKDKLMITRHSQRKSHKLCRFFLFTYFFWLTFTLLHVRYLKQLPGNFSERLVMFLKLWSWFGGFG